MLTPDKAKDAVQKYFSVLNEKFRTGQAREHAYRPTFESLMKEIDPSLKVLNDPARSEHGNPDFVFLRGDVMIGYAETKDVGIDLDKTEKGEQLARYFGYSNLILTDYLEFRFFKDGSGAGEPIRVGEIKGDGLVAYPERFVELANELTEFVSGAAEPITSGKRLAEIMGGKARRVRDNVRRFLASDSEKNAELLRVYETVKRLLVHDLSTEKFADMYAQTLVYGLFVARYNDDSGSGFSRREARDLVPASNPFLREFFDHIVGPHFDERLGYIVDELCAVFSVSDVREIVHIQFKVMGDGKDEKDPIIHFYENFLQEYDPVERKKMGAYYTPIPVVRYIVRAVDEALKRDFGLAKGLADTSRRQIDVVAQGETKKGAAKKAKVNIHRVQILDPAVGTATFLNEVVNHIHASFVGQEGRWPSYVETDLLPRLYGFELMMAPYTIAHLKLGMTLRETGCEKLHQRLGVYLTNTLEEGVRRDDQLWGFGLSQAIADEADSAARIKKDRPIMVIIGNPPYSVSSSNKGEWIQNQIKVYKEGLGEKKINLDDDYIKFIRFSEHLIEKNGSGIVAMITNNSYIDGITHRQMRKHLLETFDDIYILDLHGSTTKQEKASDGGKDENVFDIQQGVAITLFVKGVSDRKTKLGHVWHAELYGTRRNKFVALDESGLGTIQWKNLDNKEPYYFFVPKNFGNKPEYDRGFSLGDLFNVYNTGIQTKFDEVVVQFDEKAMRAVVNDFEDLEISELEKKYGPKEKSGWTYQNAKSDIGSNNHPIQVIQYRPFDYRFTCYSGKSSGFMGRPRANVMSSLLEVDGNFALVFTRQFGAGKHFIVFCTSQIMEMASQPFASYLIAPLNILTQNNKIALNLNQEIIRQFEVVVGRVEPKDIFDYVYAVLHSPKYRETYKEFLKIDFPRVPAPADDAQFQRLAVFGKELRELHLLTSPKVNDFITTYPKDGSNIVEAVSYKDGKVWINKEQYFGGVPEVAWSFYIGGYQPVQKWLKDRKGRTLSNTDIEHYQKIIVALTETDRVMREIDASGI